MSTINPFNDNNPVDGSKGVGDSKGEPIGGEKSFPLKLAPPGDSSRVNLDIPREEIIKVRNEFFNT